jgi:hypothetical protein
LTVDRITAVDWLLAETVRLHEERQGRMRDDETANVLARETAGQLQYRLARRAAALPVASGIRSDLARLRQLAWRMANLLAVLALIAGALAALSTTAIRQVDLLLAVASLLLLPGLMLVLWAGSMLFARPGRAAPGLSHGWLAMGLRKLGPRMVSGPLAAETVSAAAGLMLTGAGRWLLGALTHVFWSVYGLSALALLALLFSIAQYDLSWGTTLLDDATAVALIQAVAWLPAAVGLIEPLTAEWILAGREGVQSGALRAEWARLLLVLIMVYGILPRAVLALVCAAFGLSGLKRMSLDTARPGYLRLAGALNSHEEVDVRGAAPAAFSAPKRERPALVDGAPLLVAVELERPEWPTALPGLEWRALGRADSRSQRKALLAAAGGLDAPPPAVLAQCSALRTPDEGTGRFLSDLADAAGTVLVIWLDESSALQARGGDVAERTSDWQAMAQRVGAEFVGLDGSHPDEQGLSALRQACGVTP